jgi:hypothetical protein
MLPITLFSQGDRHGTGGDRIVASQRIGLPKINTASAEEVIGPIGGFKGFQEGDTRNR